MRRHDYDRRHRHHHRRRRREFIRNFRVGTMYPYRDQLLQRWRKKEHFLEVQLAHLNEYDADLLSMLQNQPIVYLPLFENGACIER